MNNTGQAILVIDPVTRYQNLISSVIKTQYAGEIEVAESATDALNLIGNGNLFEMITVEKNMLGINGIEFVKQFCKLKLVTPILVIGTDLEVEDEIKHLKPIEFLSKNHNEFGTKLWVEFNSMMIEFQLLIKQSSVLMQQSSVLMQQSSEAMQQSSEAIQQSSEAIQQSSEARQQSSEARQQSPPIPENMGNLGKVLVVDDDALILNLLAIVLSRLGDSHEALEKVQNENFSLIISDVQMPNMDGFMLVKKIREIDKTTPIILMSGTNKLSIAECSKLSINYYIAKPLNIPIFYEILSSI